MVCGKSQIFRETPRGVHCPVVPSLRNRLPLPVRGWGTGSLARLWEGLVLKHPSPPRGPRGPGPAGASRVVAFSSVDVGAQPGSSDSDTFRTVATTPGVRRTQCRFHVGWFVLNVFSIPSGTRDKRIVDRKSDFRMCRARGCLLCVFHACLPREGFGNLTSQDVSTHIRK